MEFLLSEPFHAVRMNVVVAPLPVARQKDLFSPEEHVVPQEELAALISRLSGRLGTEERQTDDAGSRAGDRTTVGRECN
jgi:hypothetical protein